ncbi:MAG: hypothetical protein IPM24_07000 [Bryobacterales bacterium]|nr:hypothetical protein [Bryobacterales bacterium]
MLSWFRRRPPAPLTGAPAIRRQKTYSAASGYVYQYYYEGQRRLDDGQEFVFDVSADRKTSFPVSVNLPDSAAQANNRVLGSTERYAVAKMALFAAFDERETPAAMVSQVVVGPADVVRILAELGLD